MAKVYILVSTASHSVRTMFEETNMKTVSAEMLGTFFLVFFGITAFASSDDAFAGALTLGLTLMVLMHVFGPLSGCHLNPAVTIGNMMSKKISQDDAIGYMGGQVVGATLGFVLFKFLNPDTDDSALEGDMAILVAAAVGTMFFVMTLLSTQDPFAVGAALFVVSSAAFADVNAGVDIGIMLANAIDGNADWAFFGVIGSVAGAFLGWAVKDNALD
ncbi:MAG: aquaporin [Candidatus Poseidoniia archaeon]|nr:aquaporin [Candidatus Poseidoniia archaeon]MDP7666079.1 aquaporin [Candidatus Poseidoniia archaeon]